MNLTIKKYFSIFNVLLFILALLSIVLFNYANYSIDVDDASVGYKFAENVSNFKGLVYNYGERVLGTITPLYTFVMAFFSFSVIPIPIVSNILGILFGISLIILIFITTKTYLKSIYFAFLITLILLLNGTLIIWVPSGMETAFYTFLIIATFFSYSRDKLFLATILSFLAFFCRLDGLAVPFALFITYIIDHKKLPPVKYMVIFALLSSVYIISFDFYFGSFIPASFAAKQGHVINTAPGWMFKYYFTPFILPQAIKSTAFLVPFFLIGLEKIIWSTCIKKEKTPYLIWLIWFASYLSAYIYVRLDLYEWYLVPAIPVFTVIAGYGFYSFYIFILSFVKQQYIKKLFFSLFGIFILLFFILHSLNAKDKIDGMHNYLQGVEVPRANAGKWLGENSYPDELLVSGAIGHLGYYSGLRVIDAAGLINPDLFLKKVNVVKEFQPEFVADLMTLNLDMHSNYLLIRTYELSPNYEDINIYARKDIADRYTYERILNTPEFVADDNIQNKLNINFSNKILLNGYSIDKFKMDKYLTLYWSCINNVDADYEFFMHLFNSKDKLLYQLDRRIVGYNNISRPTSQWICGEEKVYQQTMKMVSFKAPSYFRIGVYLPKIDGSFLNIINDDEMDKNVKTEDTHSALIQLKN